MAEGSCSRAGEDANHRKRAVKDDGLCATCFRERRRARRLTRRLGAVRQGFGLSEEDYGALRTHGRWLNPQGKLVCPGCRRATGEAKALAMDHNHKHCAGPKGCRLCVRGELCGPCNAVLAHFRDDPVALIRLAFYLIDPPWPRIRAWLDSR